MKKLISIVALVAVGVVMTGCHHKHMKKHGKHHKGKMEHRLPGDRAAIAPNCAADGPGCRQFNPRR